MLSSTSDSWVIDSRANEHMTGSSPSLSDYHHVNTSQSVTLANSSPSKVVCSGNKHLNCYTLVKKKKIDKQVVNFIKSIKVPLNIQKVYKTTPKHEREGKGKNNRKTQTEGNPENPYKTSPQNPETNTSH
jgi:hypothetical protein